MGKPAPHTPVAFVKAGGSAFFSANCIALLTKAGYEMKEFGTYSSVADYLSQCRKKRKAFDDAIKGGADVQGAQAAAAAVEGGDGRGLSQREFQLGEPWCDGHNPNAFCSGHQVQAATQAQSGYRGIPGHGPNAHAAGTGPDGRAGSPGDSPCMTTVDGHTTSDYPCRAEGGGGVNNGAGDSTRNAILEYNQADANAAQVDGPYANTPGAAGQQQVMDDAHARTDAIETTRREEQEKALSGSTSGGANVQPGDPSMPATHGDAAGPDGADGPKKAPRRKTVKGRSVADCIKNFHEMAAAGMRQEYVKNAAKNEDAAEAAANADPPLLTRRPVTPEDRRQAEADRRTAQSELNDAYEQRRAAQEAGDPQAEAAAQARVDAAKGPRDRARDVARAMDADCAARVGRRIESGSPQQNPRCPGGGDRIPGLNRSNSNGSCGFP